MKLVLDDTISEELKGFLLTQDGITDVKLSRDDYLTILDIKHNEKITPIIIVKFIELFQETKFPILIEFDKGTSDKFKVLKYKIDDMCCDYCYRGLVMDLFENKKIKSVKSNFEWNKPAFDIEFIIEYDENYTEKELIDYIKEKYVGR